MSQDPTTETIEDSAPSDGEELIAENDSFVPPKQSGSHQKTANWIAGLALVISVVGFLNSWLNGNESELRENKAILKSTISEMIDLRYEAMQAREYLNLSDRLIVNKTSNKLAILFSTVEEIEQELGEENITVQQYGVIGSFYLGVGNLDKAMAYYARLEKHPILWASSRRDLGSYYLVVNGDDRTEGREYFRAAIDIFKKEGSDNANMDVLYTLAMWSSKEVELGETRYAEKLKAEYEEFKQTLRNNGSSNTGP